nr:hypothetical protein [uncultured Kingella sp.]
MSNTPNEGRVGTCCPRVPHPKAANRAGINARSTETSVSAVTFSGCLKPRPDPNPFFG